MVRISYFFIAALFFLANTTLLHADALKELQKTKVYDKALTDTSPKLSSLYNLRWFSRTTWYGRVFLEEEGASLIFEWLGTDADREQHQKYTGNLINADKDIETMSVKREFVTPTFKKILVTVILPHPRSQTSCASRLVKICDELMPTAAKRFSGNVVEQAAAPTEFIKTTDNACEYFTKLPHEAFMQVKVDSCDNPAELNEFFETLDIKTLAERLGT